MTYSLSHRRAALLRKSYDVYSNMYTQIHTYFNNTTLILKAFHSKDGVTAVCHLSFNKENRTFLNSLKNNDFEAQVEFTLKVMERARATCY